MRKMNSQAEVNAVLRTDPTAFMERTFATLNGGTAYLPNWHIETLGYHLDQCRQKKIKRLIVTIPPLAIRTLFLARRDRIPEHRRLARWALPLWLYVSVTGVIIYVLLYRVYG